MIQIIFTRLKFWLSSSFHFKRPYLLNKAPQQLSLVNKILNSHNAVLNCININKKVSIQKLSKNLQRTTNRFLRMFKLFLCVKKRAQTPKSTFYNSLVILILKYEVYQNFIYLIIYHFIKIKLAFRHCITKNIKQNF